MLWGDSGLHSLFPAAPLHPLPPAEMQGLPVLLHVAKGVPGSAAWAALLSGEENPLPEVSFGPCFLWT